MKLHFICTVFKYTSFYSILVVGLGIMGFPGDLEVTNLPANAGATGDVCSIPGSGRSPGEEMATHSSILVCRIPRTEEPCGDQSMGSQKVRHDLATEQ